MRRIAGGFLLALGLIAASLTLWGWWVRHTVFNPSRTSDIVDTAFEHPEVRDELSRLIAERVAPQLGLTPGQVDAIVRTQLARPGITTVFGGVLRDVHERVIGEATGPVTVSPQLVAEAVGDPRAAQLPPVQFDVPRVDILDSTRRQIDDRLPLGLFLAVTLSALGVLVTSYRAGALRAIGWWAIGASVLQLALAYLVPVYVVPIITDNPWALLAGDIATASIAPLIGGLVMLTGAGVACLTVAAYLDRPRPGMAPVPWATTPTRW